MSKLKRSVSKIIDNIKWAWQRVFRGWDDRAVWSIDFYLSKLVPELITHLQKKGVGIPVAIFSELFSPVGPYVTDVTSEQENLAKEKWNSVLEEIKVGFEAYRDAMEKGEDQLQVVYSEKYERSWELFRKYFDCLWW